MLEGSEPVGAKRLPVLTDRTHNRERSDRGFIVRGTRAIGGRSPTPRGLQEKVNFVLCMFSLVNWGDCKVLLECWECGWFRACCW